MTTSVRPAEFDCRKAFADELAQLARADDRIVAVCNDSVGSSNLGAFRDEFPNRLINVGIAEQDLVGVAAGLANGGLIPFVSAAGPFLTGRALEQIKADVAYSQAHVILCAQSPGMAYGELGPTHHSIEDLSWMRAIADLAVVVPADPAELRAAIRWAADYDGPSYLRIGRFPVPAVNDDDVTFTPGSAQQLCDGDDVTIIAIGTMVSRALQAAAELRDERRVGAGTQHGLDRAPRYRRDRARGRADARRHRHRRGSHHDRRSGRRGRDGGRADPTHADANPRRAKAIRPNR